MPGFITTGDWHEIIWEIRLDRMRVIVDNDVRFDGPGDYSGIESAPSVGPCSAAPSHFVNARSRR